MHLDLQECQTTLRLVELIYGQNSSFVSRGNQNHITSESSQISLQKWPSNLGLLVISALRSVTINSISRRGSIRIRSSNTERCYLQCFENMVNFRDQKELYPLLEIANDERYSPTSILTLKVHPPVIGVFPLNRGSPDMSFDLDKWLTKEEIDFLDFNKFMKTTAFVLHSSTHDKESAATYPKGSNKGLVTWNYPQSGPFVNFGILRLIQYVSALVRFLFYYGTRMIRDLPIHGTFFDEVIPSAKELSQIDQQGKPFLPKTCVYFFSTFYRLSNGVSKEVSIHDWVNFWFKGPEQYKEPPPRGPKQQAKPKSNHGPNGYIDMSFLPRPKKENVPFAELGVDGSLREEMNLATFLACWICKFVLPIKKLDHICPSVFKIASLMAHRERIVGERMTRNFDLSGARHLFQNINICSIPTLSMLQPKELFIANNGELSTSWNDYFISLRLSYITLWCDDHFVMEPHSPYKFSRQFRFVQDLPENFIKGPYDGTLKELAQLWDSCTRLSSSSTISIPLHPERPLTTNRYENWCYIEQYWKRKRKKAKEQSSEFVNLDIATIDNKTFSVNEPSSIMPLTELAEQKITKENHQKLLSDVQQNLVNAKEENTKARGCIEDLQSSLAKFDEELKLLSTKRKKTISCIKEQKDQLSKSQEKIITFEGELHAIREKHPLSEHEVETLSKLKKTVELHSLVESSSKVELDNTPTFVVLLISSRPMPLTLPDKVERYFQL
ncbi:hypothetical protein CQW23_03917 [Capsicum baccatum]|uniref:Aminotransferase-like plant mobile domain-containing protein n=1 Tax=Capsicum baccatum TaxID=33114 RepID=A0A2G2XDK7_CAPBA|nr:hypothetical protein CQW23_03917 [Capsicum baccatum]